MCADRSALAEVGSRTVAATDAVPGDVADVELRDRRSGVHRGRLLTLIRPSPVRVRPLCPLFERCGGCQWQRIDATAQAEYKGALIVRALEAAGHTGIPIRVVPATAAWGYRTAGTYVPVGGGGDPALGLHAAVGRSAVSIHDCPVQSPVLQTAFEEMQRAWRELAPRLSESGQPGTLCRGVRIRVSEASHEAAVGLILGGRITPAQRDAIVKIIGAHVTGLVEIAAKPAQSLARSAGPMSDLRWGRPGVVETVLGRWYHVPVFAPFPVTGRGASGAISFALESLALDEDTTLLEPDAGVGAYTLAAAAAASRVVARTAPEYLHVARHNAAWNDVSNAAFVARSSQTLAALARLYGRARRALVQVTREAIPFDALDAAGVRRAVLVANSPAPLAGALSAAGADGFRAESVTVIDTHPQTSRAEIQVTLEARRRTWAGRRLEGGHDEVAPTLESRRSLEVPGPA